MNPTTDCTGDLVLCESCGEAELHICWECYQETLPGVMLPCSHAWCTQCLGSALDAYCMDSLSSLPRCCGAVIPLHEYLDLMPDEYRTRYVNAQRDQFYCANRTCSARLVNSARTEENQIAARKCPECQKSTCEECKMLLEDHNVDQATGNQTCPTESEDILAVRRLGDQHGWKPCPECGQMYERTAGCNSMVCETCGTRFCYICGDTFGVDGARQGLCGCPQGVIHRMAVEEGARGEEVEEDDLF